MAGSVSQVIGAVVDCQFGADEPIPAIYSALTVPMGKHKLTLEVQQHLEQGLVRAIAMGSTDGLQRGAPVTNTGEPIQVPVGPETLGRMARNGRVSI